MNTTDRIASARAEAPIRLRFDVYRDLRTVEGAFKRAALLGATLMAFGFGLGVVSSTWAASQRAEIEVSVPATLAAADQQQS